jgi:hypothetical protein
VQRSSVWIVVWNEPWRLPERTVSQFHPPSTSCWSSSHDNAASTRSSTVPNVAARATTIAVMQVSGSGTVLANVNPPSR